MVAVVFGIQGVGKSSLVQAIVKGRGDFTRLYWGENSLKTAQQEGLAQDVDQVRNLPVAEQKILQKKVGMKFADTINSDRTKNYVIETHAALKTQQGFMAGFTPEILEAIKPDIFFVIESHAIDIYHRRILDETRKRDHDKTVREIQLNLDATRWFATTFSVLSGANLMMIENVEDNLDVAVTKIAEVLDIYLGN
jgi:adenylate kinase